GVLFCQTRPCSDLEIAPKRIESRTPPARKQITAFVFHLGRPAPDVTMLHLRYPVQDRVRFRAGQYLQVLLQDGTRRNYSMAGPPQETDGARRCMSATCSLPPLPWRWTPCASSRSSTTPPAFDLSPGKWTRYDLCGRYDLFHFDGRAIADLRVQAPAMIENLDQSEGRCPRWRRLARVGGMSEGGVITIQPAPYAGIGSRPRSSAIRSPL
ncbi:MAG: hypothetical protein M3Y55_02970, partial [Pseudomonadota bacterium]|nr:hypothetical protein [Pseudomonadota bacterium]